MTIEELKGHCVRQIKEFERIKEIMPVTPNGYKHYEEHKMVLQLIEAWEKVKEKIRKEIRPINFVGAEYDGLERAIEIIDEHLSEVENDNKL